MIREHAAGVSDWAIRSVSLQGQEKVMESGASLPVSQTKLLSEITRPGGQMSPIIYGRGVWKQSVFEGLKMPVCDLDGCS